MTDKNLSIKVILDEGAYMPEKAHEQDAGFDLRTPEAFSLPAEGSAVIDTGVHMLIPEGYVGFLKSKSGLNVKHGITGEGVIDAGYTGPIVVKLYRRADAGSPDYEFRAGDKIIQIVILPIPAVTMNQVCALPDTERSSKGFGSSGR